MSRESTYALPRWRVEIGDHVSTVWAEDANEATAKVIKRKWGSRCSWMPDSGVRGWGTVVRSVEPRGCLWAANVVSKRIRLDVVKVAT